MLTTIPMSALVNVAIFTECNNWKLLKTKLISSGSFLFVHPTQPEAEILIVLVTGIIRLIKVYLSVVLLLSSVVQLFKSHLTLDPVHWMWEEDLCFHLTRDQDLHQELLHPPDHHRHPPDRHLERTDLLVAPCKTAQDLSIHNQTAPLSCRLFLDADYEVRTSLYWLQWLVAAPAYLPCMC